MSKDDLGLILAKPQIGKLVKVKRGLRVGLMISAEVLLRAATETCCGPKRLWQLSVVGCNGGSEDMWGKCK